MNHCKTLLNFIETRASITKDERKTLMSSFIICSKSKKDYLVRQTHRAHHLFFIVNGSVRFFRYDNRGNEITTHLSRANNFVTSFDSFLYGKPSTENVQCTSECELLSVAKKEYDKLYKTVNEWSLFCQKIYEDYIREKEERIYLFQHLSATERYQK